MTPPRRAREYAAVTIALFGSVRRFKVSAAATWTLRLPKQTTPVELLQASQPTVKGHDFIEATLRFEQPEVAAKHRRLLEDATVLERNGVAIASLQVASWHAAAPELPTDAGAPGDRYAKEAATALVILAEPLGLKLDYSPESLADIDRWIAPHKNRASSISDSFVLMAGCYVGEVIRRHLGGRWVNVDQGPFPALEVRRGVVCDPVHKVAMLRSEGMGESVAFYFQAVMTLSRRAQQ